MSMEITQINLFPFKSLKGFTLQECEVDKHGFKYDRIYMLVHKTRSGEWRAMTQREEPAMARITTEIKDDKLILSHEKGAKVELPLDHSKLPETGPNIDLLLWGEDLSCRKISTDEDARFFADYFGSPQKYDTTNLAIVAPGTRRTLDAQSQQHTRDFIAQSENIQSSFQDVFPCTVMTTASHENLQEHVSIMSEGTEIKTNSFRMNLIVDTDEPWIEDDWLQIKIAGHIFHVDSPLERCPIPSIDQEKGEFRQKRHPAPALNRFRVLEAGRTPCFGLNVVNKDSGFSVKVGDKVEVLEMHK